MHCSANWLQPHTGALNILELRARSIYYFGREASVTYVLDSFLLVGKIARGGLPLGLHSNCNQLASNQILKCLLLFIIVFPILYCDNND